ncbi:T9SS type A sorting domain-containing protein [bacterium]|nr:T9SS type A sorting domain-containing protein [bacterium]
MHKGAAVLLAVLMCAGSMARAAEWETVELPEGVKVWDMDMQGSVLWFSSQGLGLVGYDAGEWLTHRQSEGGIRNDRWNYRVFVTADGGKWITRDSGSTLDRLDDAGTFSDKTDDVWRYYDYEEELANKRVFSAAEDSQGRMWFGMRDENLSRTGVLELFIDHADTTAADDEWFHYDNVWTPDSTSFAGDDVRALMVDDRDRLWIGYYGSGIDMWDYGDPTVFADDEWTHFTESDGLPGDDVHTFGLGSDGSIWAGTLEGLAVLDEISGVWVAIEGLPGNQARALSEDAQGHMWVGTDEGVAMLYANRTVAFTYTPQDGLADERVDHLSVDRNSGDIWAVTMNTVADETTLNRFRSGIVEGTGALFVYPNPWREGVSEEHIHVYGAPEGSLVEIYDITGEKVAELARSEPYIWNSLDESLNEVPSGVYLVRVEQPDGRTEMVKLAIVR